MAPPALDDPSRDAPTVPEDAEQQQQDTAATAILNEGEDDEYNSEEDSDFDVNAPAEDAESDADESEGEETLESDARPRKRRRVGMGDEEGGETVGEDEEFVMGELESGDEVTIREGEKRKRRTEKGKKGGDDDDEGGDFEIDEDEAGGEGGFVRTRAMKMKIQEERRPLARTDGATVDVDALWEQMNADPDSVITTPQPNQKQDESTGDKDVEMADGDKAPVPPRPDEETITIKRTYKFAGEVITEEKTVPKDSAEAKLYLESLKSTKSTDKNADDNDAQKPKVRRPLRRISRFDPNPPDAIKKSWAKQANPEETPKGPKLNTVMKSKLDWAAYVDREGIKDDLDMHGRAKDSYLNRADFLDRMEAKREEERRNLRLKNVG